MYKFKLRSNYVKKVEVKHDIPLSYIYEPDIDPEIIEGRLLINVFLYTHHNVLNRVVTTVCEILDFCGMNTGITHWKTSAGIRKLQKGLDWMIGRGYVEFTDGRSTLLAERRYNDVIYITIDPALFNVGLSDAKHTDPYILLYERDIARILAADVKYPEKVFRIYCYIRACLFNTEPYVATIPMQSIADDTGYSISYVSRTIRLLCESLGVLHRVALSRTSEQYPPYMYIANIPNWEQLLQDGSAEWNDERGGVPVKQPEYKTTSTPAPSEPISIKAPPILYRGEAVSPDFRFETGADAYEVFNLPFTIDTVPAISQFFMTSPLIKATDITKRYQLKGDIMNNIYEEAAKIGVDASRFVENQTDDYLANAIVGRKIVNGEINID